MAKVLYITANPKALEQSYGLSVGKAFIDEYRRLQPEDEIIDLDLYQIRIPYIDIDVFNGWGKLKEGTEYEKLPQDEKEKIGLINELTEQFVSADKYVFVTPMWNFSFPPKVKAYIDTICIAGKTFKYTDNGPVGLLGGKKAVHIQARGGIYSKGPAKDLEFGDRYLRAIFGFVGITDVESVIVEGMAQMPDQAEAIKERAIARAKEAAGHFAKELVKV